jgi:hypothetical protein
MNACARRIIGIFGALLAVVALLLVPVQRTTVTTQSGFGGIGTRTTVITKEFTNLISFVKNRGERVSASTGAKVTTVLRGRMFAYEAGAVILLGVCDYVLFCIRVRRPRPRR